MPEKLLSAAFVKTAPSGRHSDGAGLWAYVREPGNGYWVLRFHVHGKRREAGLGSLKAVSLAEARQKAAIARAQLALGVDPIREKHKQARAASKPDSAFAVVAQQCFEARKSELKGDGLAGRWFSPLELHAIPALGRLPVDEITARDIRDALAGVWHKGDVGRKTINRINVIMRYAAALGLAVDLQAPLKAKALLGKSRHEPKHIEAVPWAEVPAFYASLAEPSIVHLALKFLILTGVRSKPARFLRLEQIEGDTWTIPAEHVKGLKGKTSDFRVPLSREALAVIEAAKAHARDGFLFPSTKPGVPISDMSMSQSMARRGVKERPHGFRSSLRVWLAEATDASHEVAEAVLGHATGSAVSRAYQRSDFLEQRRALLERWGDFVAGGSGALVQLAARR
jgi:integrase